LKHRFAEYAKDFIEGCQPGTILEAEFEKDSEMDDATEALRAHGCRVRRDAESRRLYVTTPHVPPLPLPE